MKHSETWVYNIGVIYVLSDECYSVSVLWNFLTFTWGIMRYRHVVAFYVKAKKLNIKTCGIFLFSLCHTHSNLVLNIQCFSGKGFTDLERRGFRARRLQASRGSSEKGEDPGHAQCRCWGIYFIFLSSFFTHLRDKLEKIEQY